MRESWGSGLIVRAVVAIVAAIALLELGTAAETPPQSRTWTTKDGKHKVDAVLVEHSIVDVTIKLENGQKKTIKLSLMSDADTAYLKGFPSLAGKAKATNLPWVRVQAKTKASKRTGTSRSYAEVRSKSMEITVTNRSKESLDLTILYGFLNEDLTGRNREMRQTRVSDLNLEGVRVKKLTIGGQKDMQFVTEAMQTVEINRYRTKSGSKTQGFIVQAYWKGQLLNGWAADSNLRDMANDGRLIERFGGHR